MSSLSIFIGVIVLFIIFFIIFLFLGLKIYLKLNKKDNKFKAVITVKWTVINIFSKKFHTNDEIKKKIENKSIEKEKKEIDQSKEKSSKKWKDFIQLYPLLKSNINPIFDYILICIDSIKLQKFDTHIIIGLSNFTDTATFTGYIWAFSTIPNLSDHFTLTAEPIFTKETIDFESEIIFKIKLLKPFLGILKLFTKKTMLKLIWNLRVLM